MKYVVYLTTYLGNKLPPFYIGSTSEKRLRSGYNGSVKSKKYKTIWDTERAENPHLFKTTKLSRTYHTYKEAQRVEARLQKSLGVVRSSMYVNMAIATSNGCFGRDVSGANHPLFNKGHTESSRIKISENHSDVSGANNPRAKWIEIESPDGEKTQVFGEFKKFCKKNGLPYSSMCLVLKGRTFGTGKCVGWSVRYCDQPEPNVIQ